MNDEAIRKEQAMRLKQVREAAGYKTAVDAARALRARGLIGAESTYLGHENASRGMQRSAAVAYSRFFKFRLAWLLTGEGDSDQMPESVEVPPPDAPPSLSLPEYDLRAGAAYTGGVDGGGEFQDGEISGHAPIAHWGLPASFVENEVGLKYGFADVITIEGDSMDDGSRSALMSGDRVVVDRRSTNVRQGGIFAIWDGGGVIVKRVEYVRGSEPASILCKSLNPAYTPFSLVLDGNTHIIGRVAVKIMRM